MLVGNDAGRRLLREEALLIERLSARHLHNTLIFTRNEERPCRVLAQQRKTSLAGCQLHSATSAPAQPYRAIFFKRGPSTPADTLPF